MTDSCTSLKNQKKSTKKIVDWSDLGPELDHEDGEKIVDLSLYLKFSSKRWLKDSATALHQRSGGGA